MQTEMKSNLIEIKGLQISHTVAGSGLPLLMLHGWGANTDLLRPLAEKLLPLGFQIHMLDLPGFGASEPPSESWTVFDYAQFTTDYLDSQGLEQVNLFGHSFGGRLGLILGSEQPQRINRMALANSAGIRTPPKPMAEFRLRSYRGIRDTLNALGARNLAEQLRLSYNARYGSTDFQQLSGVMRQSFVHIVNQDLADYAQRVSVPTLLFWGDKDEDTPLWQGQKLEKLIPDAGLIVHEGAGHYCYLDRLAETARIMDYFFKQS